MKYLLLTSAFILSSSVAFSQLFVRPTPGGSSIDSYVYVKGEILYATGDVDLQKNGAGDFEASIYLRNQGQLIQGGTTSINKGNGFLSAQQNSMPTNAFAYYYWCSPVGNPQANGGSTIEGNKNFGLGSIYEDTNTVVGEGTKASLSANISGYNGYSNPLTISRRWSYTLTSPGTEDEGNWVRMQGGNAAPAGFGFTMKGVNEGTAGSNTANITLDQTYEFRGRPNNGDFVIPVRRVKNNGDAQMTLTGNPYPSALDLNQLSAGNNFLAAVYFYDEDRSKMTHNYGGKPYGYGVWVADGVDPTPGDGSADYPGLYAEAAFYIWDRGITHGSTIGNGTTDNYKRYAPIGQGFMFVGTRNNRNVTIRNSYRIFQKEGSGNLSVFHRPDNSSEDDSSVSTEEALRNGGLAVSANPHQLDNRTSLLRLYVVFDDALTRDLVLSFSPEATLGYDRGYDGPSPFQMKSDAYFPIVSEEGVKEPYVIQSTNFDAFEQVPITFKLHNASQIEILAAEEIRKPYQQAYLYDQQEDTYKPLERGHSLAGTFTLPAGTYEDRFFIRFRARIDPREDVAFKMDPLTQVKMDVGLFQNNPAKQLEVRNPEGYSLKSASVYDMSGKLVISENNLGDNTNYTFYTGNLSDGVYLVKLIASEDIVIDYKAMVMNK